MRTRLTSGADPCGDDTGNADLTNFPAEAVVGGSGGNFTQARRAMDAEPATALLWRETSADPFPLNTLLRQHGWCIVSRPDNGTAIWDCDGITCTFDEALCVVLEAYDWVPTKQGWAHAKWTGNKSWTRLAALKKLMDLHDQSRKGG